MYEHEYDIINNFSTILYRRKTEIVIITVIMIVIILMIVIWIMTKIFSVLKVSCQPQYSFGLRSMKMVTLLAGKQLQRDLVKKRPNTMGSVREQSFSDLNGDAGLLLRHYKGEASPVS